MTGFYIVWLLLVTWSGIWCRPAQVQLDNEVFTEQAPFKNITDGGNKSAIFETTLASSELVDEFGTFEVNDEYLPSSTDDAISADYEFVDSLEGDDLDDNMVQDQTTALPIVGEDTYVISVQDVFKDKSAEGERGFEVLRNWLKHEHDVENDITTETDLNVSPNVTDTTEVLLNKSINGLATVDEDEKSQKATVKTENDLTTPSTENIISTVNEKKIVTETIKDIEETNIVLTVSPSDDYSTTNADDEEITTKILSHIDEEIATNTGGIVTTISNNEATSKSETIITDEHKTQGVTVSDELTDNKNDDKTDVESINTTENITFNEDKLTDGESINTTEKITFNEDKLTDVNTPSNITTTNAPVTTTIDLSKDVIGEITDINSTALDDLKFDLNKNMTIMEFINKAVDEVYGTAYSQNMGNSAEYEAKLFEKYSTVKSAIENKGGEIIDDVLYMKSNKSIAGIGDEEVEGVSSLEDHNTSEEIIDNSVTTIKNNYEDDITNISMNTPLSFSETDNTTPNTATSVKSIESKEEMVNNTAAVDITKPIALNEVREVLETILQEEKAEENETKAVEEAEKAMDKKGDAVDLLEKALDEEIKSEIQEEKVLEQEERFVEEAERAVVEAEKVIENAQDAIKKEENAKQKVEKALEEEEKLTVEENNAAEAEEKAIEEVENALAEEEEAIDAAEKEVENKNADKTVETALMEEDKLIKETGKGVENDNVEAPAVIELTNEEKPIDVSDKIVANDNAVNTDETTLIDKVKPIVESEIAVKNENTVNAADMVLLEEEKAIQKAEIEVENNNDDIAQVEQIQPILESVAQSSNEKENGNVDILSETGAMKTTEGDSTPKLIDIVEEVTTSRPIIEIEAFTTPKVEHIIEEENRNLETDQSRTSKQMDIVGEVTANPSIEEIEATITPKLFEIVEETTAHLETEGFTTSKQIDIVGEITTNPSIEEIEATTTPKLFELIKEATTNLEIEGSGTPKQTDVVKQVESDIDADIIAQEYSTTATDTTEEVLNFDAKQQIVANSIGNMVTTASNTINIIPDEVGTTSSIKDSKYQTDISVETVTEVKHIEATANNEDNTKTTILETTSSVPQATVIKDVGQTRRITDETFSEEEITTSEAMYTNPYLKFTYENVDMPDTTEATTENNIATSDTSKLAIVESDEATTMDSVDEGIQEKVNDILKNIEKEVEAIQELEDMKAVHNKDGDATGVDTIGIVKTLAEDSDVGNVDIGSENTVVDQLKETSKTLLEDTAIEEVEEMNLEQKESDVIGEDNKSTFTVDNDVENRNLNSENKEVTVKTSLDDNYLKSEDGVVEEIKDIATEENIQVYVGDNKSDISNIGDSIVLDDTKSVIESVAAVSKEIKAAATDVNEKSFEETKLEVDDTTKIADNNRSSKIMKTDDSSVEDNQKFTTDNGNIAAEEVTPEDVQIFAIHTNPSKELNSIGKAVNTISSSVQEDANSKPSEQLNPNDNTLGNTVSVVTKDTHNNPSNILNLNGEAVEATSGDHGQEDKIPGEQNGDNKIAEAISEIVEIDDTGKDDSTVNKPTSANLQIDDITTTTIRNDNDVKSDDLASVNASVDATKDTIKTADETNHMKDTDLGATNALVEEINGTDEDSNINSNFTKPIMFAIKPIQEADTSVDHYEIVEPTRQTFEISVDGTTEVKVTEENAENIDQDDSIVVINEEDSATDNSNDEDLSGMTDEPISFAFEDFATIDNNTQETHATDKTSETEVVNDNSTKNSTGSNGDKRELSTAEASYNIATSNETNTSDEVNKKYTGNISYASQDTNAVDDISNTVLTENLNLTQVLAMNNTGIVYISHEEDTTEMDYDCSEEEEETDSTDNTEMPSYSTVAMNNQFDDIETATKKSVKHFKVDDQLAAKIDAQLSHNINDSLAEVHQKVETVADIIYGKLAAKVDKLADNIDDKLSGEIDSKVSDKDGTLDNIDDKLADDVNEKPSDNVDETLVNNVNENIDDTRSEDEIVDDTEEALQEIMDIMSGSANSREVTDNRLNRRLFIKPTVLPPIEEVMDDSTTTVYRRFVITSSPEDEAAVHTWEFDFGTKEFKTVLDLEKAVDEDIKQIDALLDVQNITEEITEGVNGVVRDGFGDVCFVANLSIRININMTSIPVPSNASITGNCSENVQNVKLSWKSEETENINNTISFIVVMDDGFNYISSMDLKIYDPLGEEFISQSKELDAKTFLLGDDLVPKSESIAFDYGVVVEFVSSSFTAGLHRIDEPSSIKSMTLFALQIASASACVLLILIVIGIMAYKRIRSKTRIFKVSNNK